MNNEEMNASDLSRVKKAKLNIVLSLIGQVITIVCGLIAPKALLGAFGSEQYGATTSIIQFLSYITLLEGGIGGVARAALYKPLAEKNYQTIGHIIYEIKHFFTIIGCVFAAYVVILGCSFKYISHLECFDWFSSFLLVLVISISTFGQYFIGITYSVLLQASQESYIANGISAVTLVFNTISVVILVKARAGLIFIKLITSSIFFLRPVLMYLYVRKRYPMIKSIKSNEKYLNQKLTGLGQHLAYFFHSNIDVVVLTILADLRVVAVYSVYFMVISSIQNLTSSFSSGMEALFGDLLAKKEFKKLDQTFDYYEMLISLVSVVLFSCTLVLIVPFVGIYTKSITDVNYSRPVFSVILILASWFTCLRHPYHSMVIAAGHFKQTRFAAYGEAIINIILSVVLVSLFDLIGVAIGTLVAVLFRFIYYVVYVEKNIVFRPIKKSIKRLCVNIASISVIYILGLFVQKLFVIENYLTWMLIGIAVFAAAFSVAILFNFMFYRSTFDTVKNAITKRIPLFAKRK